MNINGPLRRSWSSFPGPGPGPAPRGGTKLPSAQKSFQTHTADPLLVA
jgi:hypothetical protein